MPDRTTQPVPEGDQPLVTVVTPFYNTAAYLEECIASVYAQTYTNWEYFLVNNKSTDGSRKIAEDFCSRDSRIKLIDNDEFLTQVQNYNRALSYVSDESQYVKVVEADNWLYPECLAKMVALLQANPNVGIVSSYNITEDFVRFSGLPTATSVVSGRELAKLYMLGDAYLFGAPTTVLMRSIIVRQRQPFYDEIYAEDLSACYETLQEWDFGFVHQILSFVRTYNDSILSTIRSLARQGDFSGSVIDRYLMVERHGRTLLETESEYRQAFRIARQKLYRQLAVGWLNRQGEEFWQLHRSALASVDTRIDRLSLFAHILVEFLRLLANPGSTFAALRRRANSRSDD